MYLNRARIVAFSWAVPFGLAVIGTAPGFAQSGLGNSGGLSSGSKQNLQTLDKSAKPVAAPPSLPGTKAPIEAAQPTMSPADMTPTDALFDAINRGDTGGARDAVNRGADMQGVNVLGLTPLELSVDLGRNDISFLLLSMRDGDASSRSATRTGAESGRQADAILRAGAAARPGGRARIAAAASRGAEDTPASGPPLFSGNGGAPIPAAGFVGFDSGRAVR
jgi:hypothetical protein